MNLLNLDYFRKVAKYQSVTKPAEELHITQPTLSNSLHRLESELGIKLFNRHGRALVLSPDGKEFLKSVNSIFSLLASKNQLSILTGSADCVEITIGCIRTESILHPIIAEYTALHPNVLFRTISKPRLDNSRWSDVADFVISPYTKELANKNKCRLPDTEQYVILPSSHPLASQETINIKDVSLYPQILIAPPDELTPKGLSIATRAGLKPNVRYITEDRFSAVCMLMQKTHIMLMPKEDAISICKLSNNILTYRPLILNILPNGWKIDVYLSWSKTEALSPEAQDFLKFTMEKLNLKEL